VQSRTILAFNYIDTILSTNPSTIGLLNQLFELPTLHIIKEKFINSLVTSDTEKKTEFYFEKHVPSLNRTFICLTLKI
jgi:hypothetical protein